MSYHNLYAQVLQALPQAVCHCDEQGIIRESNPAAQALLGYAPEVLQQTWWLELVHVSDQAHIEDAWHALQTQADVPPCTVRCLRGDSYKDSRIRIEIRIGTHMVVQMRSKVHNMRLTFLRMYLCESRSQQHMTQQGSSSMCFCGSSIILKCTLPIT